MQIISPSTASCRVGRVTVEVPPQARGLQIMTPQMNVTDLGTVFGLDVKASATESHVFEGSVEFLPASPACGCMWLHVAVVLDGSAKPVSHFINGQRVSEKRLEINSPFRIGAAELGNWNARGFPDNNPFIILNFSGAMNGFFLFSRALPDAEIRAHSSDKPPR